MRRCFVEVITAGSDALVLNLGTINYNKMIAMERSAVAAKKKGIPVVLDPVGVMSSALRLNFALKLLKGGYVNIVRGNYDECRALADEKAAGHGVDGVLQADDVSNGKQVLVLNGGNEMLKKIIGAGCITTTLCACCAAVTKDYMTAAALGVVIMGQAAELAAGFMEKKDGPGMFKTRLFDGIYHVTGKWNLINLKPEERMKPVIDYSIYLVTDTVYFKDDSIYNKLEAALSAGVTLLQYRDKSAETRILYERALKVKNLCDKYRVPLIINDRADIAFAVKAAGVHLGQSDLPPLIARRMLGSDAVIGVSAHNADEALKAEADTADYLGCGAVYATATKKDTSVIGTEGLKKIRAATKLPFVGIGGITLENYKTVLQAGADGAAIVSAILGADDICQTVRKLKNRALEAKSVKI